MFEHGEIVVFVLALVLTPPMLLSLRRVNLAGKTFFAITYVAMLVSYGSAVAALVVWPTAMVVVSHAATACAAVAVAVASWQLARSLTLGRGGR